MTKTFHKEIDAYSSTLVVTWEKDYDTFLKNESKKKDLKVYQKAIRSENMKESLRRVSSGDSVGVSWSFGRYYFVVLPNKPSKKMNDVILHETFHITQMICKYVGSWNEVESPAYLYESIFRSIMELSVV